MKKITNLSKLLSVIFLALSSCLMHSSATASVLDNQFIQALVDPSSGENIHELIQEGANIDTQWFIEGHAEAAIHWTVRHQDDQDLRLLIFSGANLNALNGRGDTPLHVAVKAQNPRACEL